VASGGLHIVGTERHESRRIDNQLRAVPAVKRSGLEPLLLVARRQFDAHFRRPDAHEGAHDRVGMKAGEAIESGMLTRQIERAQRGRAAQISMPATAAEYDDVANDQRRVSISSARIS